VIGDCVDVCIDEQAVDSHQPLANVSSASNALNASGVSKESDVVARGRANVMARLGRKDDQQPDRQRESRESNDSSDRMQQRRPSHDNARDMRQSREFKDSRDLRDTRQRDTYVPRDGRRQGARDSRESEGERMPHGWNNGDIKIVQSSRKDDLEAFERGGMRSQ